MLSPLSLASCGQTPVRQELLDPVSLRIAAAIATTWSGYQL
jgi:hypothetical protein